MCKMTYLFASYVETSKARLSMLCLLFTTILLTLVTHKHTLTRVRTHTHPSWVCSVLRIHERPWTAIFSCNQEAPRLKDCYVFPGYGFVDFDSPAAAQKAVNALKSNGVQAQMAKVRVHLFENLSFLLILTCYSLGFSLPVRWGVCVGEPTDVCRVNDSVKVESFFFFFFVRPRWTQ